MVFWDNPVWEIMLLAGATDQTSQAPPAVSNSEHLVNEEYQDSEQGCQGPASLLRVAASLGNIKNKANIGTRIL